MAPTRMGPEYFSDRANPSRSHEVRSRDHGYELPPRSAIPLYHESGHEDHHLSIESDRTMVRSTAPRSRLLDMRPQEVFSGLGGLFRDREADRRHKERSELDRYLDELPQILEDLERFAQRSTEDRKRAVVLRNVEHVPTKYPRGIEKSRSPAPMPIKQKDGPAPGKDRARDPERWNPNVPKPHKVSDQRRISIDRPLKKVVPIAFLIVAALLYVYVTLRVLFKVPLMGLGEFHISPKLFFIIFITIIILTVLMNSVVRAITILKFRKRRAGHIGVLD